MGESRTAVTYPEWTSTTVRVVEDRSDRNKAYPGEKESGCFDDEGCSPAAIWASGILYSAYYIGEVLHAFEIADHLINQWIAGQLKIQPGKATILLERLLKKRSRRSTAEARARLYQRVFQVEASQTAIEPGRSFRADWDSLMRGSAAYESQRAGGENEAVEHSRAQIRQATRHLQHGISVAMSGSAYLMAAEVATQLHETLELLRSSQIANLYHASAGDLLCVIESAAPNPVYTGQTAPTGRILALAEAGNRILQDWVAAYEPRLAMDSRLPVLLEPARAWNAAWGALTVDGGLPGRTS